jgi:16S rRNA U516 pseudouridylate synthase RsuA-like enzyme
MQPPHEPKSHYKENPFELVQVIAAKAPDGGTGDRWCKYVITQGKNQIVGYSQGSLRRVKRDAKFKVEELNRRRYGGKKAPAPARNQKKPGTAS